MRTEFTQGHHALGAERSHGDRCTIEAQKTALTAGFYVHAHRRADNGSRRGECSEALMLLFFAAAPSVRLNGNNIRSPRDRPGCLGKRKVLPGGGMRRTLIEHGRDTQCATGFMRAFDDLIDAECRHAHTDHSAAAFVELNHYRLQPVVV